MRNDHTCETTTIFALAKRILHRMGNYRNGETTVNKLAII
ncbi:unnamed protein product [Tenebrio molitor]|nr:unnamed protein product [Tenebrio molitor]